MADINLPQTQRAAKTAGITRYFTGNPCPAGHIAARMTCNYWCVICLANAPRRKEHIAAYKVKNRDRIREETKLWREANPNYSAEYHLKNQAARNAKSKAWRERNPGRNAEYLAAYRVENKERIQAQIREWQLANPERSRAAEKAWRTANAERAKATFQKYYAENRHIFIAAARCRHNMQIQATPAWADLDKIGAIYRRAHATTKETGIEHEVDHIVPLNSKRVCGLHVEYNLQILTRIENRVKSNNLLE